MRGSHLDRSRRRHSPVVNAFIEMERGTVPFRDSKMRVDGVFREYDAGLTLVQGDHAWLGRERRESPMDFRGVEHVVIEIVFTRAAQAAAHHVAVRRADHQPTGHLEEMAAGIALELPPELVRAPEQRHVCGILEVGEANDARTAVTGSMRMPRLKLLEPEDPLAARGDMRCGGAAHAAEPDDDHIEYAHVAM